MSDSSNTLPTSLRRAKRECLFCGSSLRRQNRAKEHVFPQWLLDFTGTTAKDLQAATHLNDVGVVVNRRIQGTRTMLQGSVCSICNNEWMSELENRAKSLVLPAAQGKELTLDKQQCVLIAAWAAKTMMLFNISTNYRELVPRARFSHFYKEQTPPPGHHVEIGYVQQSVNVGIRTSMAPIKVLYTTEEDKRTIIELLDRESYVLSFHFKCVAFRIVGLPRIGVWQRVDPVDGMIQLYPRSPGSLEWPPTKKFQGSVEQLRMVSVRLVRMI